MLVIHPKSVMCDCNREFPNRCGNWHLTFLLRLWVWNRFRQFSGA